MVELDNQWELEKIGGGIREASIMLDKIHN